jgi:Trp operon repressor
MVRISKRPLSTNTIKKMQDLFYEVIVKDISRENFQSIFSDIITPSENIVFIKRVFILYLISKDIPQDEIVKALKVSSSTVSKYALYYLNCSKPLKTILKSIENKEKIINIIDDLFAELFIRPGLYKNHWSLYTDYINRKRKRDMTGI